PNRSGSSTQISVNGTSIGSTTAATINVDAGWAGTTGLNASNTAAGAYTLTSSQLVSPGLTVNFRNLGGLQLFAGLLGGNNVVNVNGQPGILPNSQLSIATGGGNDVVTIGNGTTPLPVADLLAVVSTGGNDQLILNDQGTTAARTWAFRASDGVGTI